MRRLARSGLTRSFLARLETREIAFLNLHEWPVFALQPQRPPLKDWRTWLLLGGRGAGKTRAGAEWLKAIVGRDRHYSGDAAGRVAIIGETYSDARAVMIEGESGLLALYPRGERPTWNPSRRQLVWRDGTIGQVYSASDPEGLRGSQFGAAWLDELAKWRHLEETWDMMQFCLRLGKSPRQMATTTPKPLPLLKRLLADPETAVTRSGTRDNAAHLAPGFLDYLTSRYGGTRLGRQELDGEIVEDIENALWQRSVIENNRCTYPSTLDRIVVAVDPPATSHSASAACGIVGAGRDGNGKCYVLADKTIEKAPPIKWARTAISLFESLEADAIIAEVNQGGEMVKSVIHSVDPTVPVRPVHATRGKWLRAEPVAVLYERGLVSHAGAFPKLEDQMCAFGIDGLASGKSPDRLDALVWAISSLALAAHSNPRIRRG